MTRKSIIAACLVLGGFAAAPVMAQQAAPVANPTQTVANFDAATVGPILSEMGITWQATQGSDGTTYIMANAGGELMFYMRPVVCGGANNTGCIGVQTFALFDGAANAPTVTAFNNRYPFANAGVDEGGDVYLSRYDIADYGVARGNVAVLVGNFVHLAGVFRKTLATTGRTVSLEGFSDDLASRALNRGVLTDIGGEVESSLFGHHQIGFEEAAVDLKAFISDEAMPRNKIMNITAK